MQTTPRRTGAANKRLLRRFIERTRARLSLAAQRQYETDGNVNSEEVLRLNALLQQLWAEYGEAGWPAVAVAEEDLQAKQAWGASREEPELSCALSTLPLRCRDVQRRRY